MNQINITTLSKTELISHNSFEYQFEILLLSFLHNYLVIYYHNIRSVFEIGSPNPSSSFFSLPLSLVSPCVLLREAAIFLFWWQSHHFLFLFVAKGLITFVLFLLSSLRMFLFVPLICGCFYCILYEYFCCHLYGCFGFLVWILNYK